jgi:uncharacterized protein (DUF2147 family)
MIAMLGALLAAPVASAQTSADPTGVWQTQAGDARVRVARCGGMLCGTVVSLRDKIDPATGRAPVDNKNPDPSKGNRPIVGLQLFGDMRQVGEARWNGHIYNADDGGTYVSNLTLVNADALRVEGCVGAICGGEIWSRVGR